MLLGRYSKIIKKPVFFLYFCYMRQALNITERCFQYAQQSYKHRSKIDQKSIKKAMKKLSKIYQK